MIWHQWERPWTHRKRLMARGLSEERASKAVSCPINVEMGEFLNAHSKNAALLVGFLTTNALTRKRQGLQSGQ